VVLSMPWTAMNPNWEATNQVDERYAVTDLFLLETKGEMELKLDVTELVRAWIIDGIANNGLVLRSSENLPSLLNSSVMTVGTTQPKVSLMIYFSYNPN
jgi:hypothetical protein